MTIPATPIQQIALGDQVTEALRRLIIVGDVKAGTRLTEVSLAEQFGVSRGPVRESFARLEAEGLLQAGRKGMFVIGLKNSDVDELYSLRQTLETFAITLLFDRRSELDWTPLQREVDRMSAAAEGADMKAFGAADIGFHSAIYELAGHRRLLDVWRSYEKSFGVVLEQSGRHGLDLQVGADDHARLLATLKSASLAECHDAVGVHLRNAHRRLAGLFDD